MKKDDELRKKLTALLEDYEAEPEEKTWENIRAAIQSERRRKPLYPFFFGIGLALLTTCVAGWWLFPANNERVAALYAPHASNVVGHRMHAAPFAAYAGKPVRTALRQSERTAMEPQTAVTSVKRAKTATIRPNTVAALPAPAPTTTPVNTPETGTINPEQPRLSPVSPGFSPGLRPFAPEKALHLLPVTAMPLLPPLKKTLIMPPPAEARYHLRIPYRPLHYWVAGVQVLQTGQTMTALTHDEHTATNIRQRRGVNSQRTGISVDLGYRRALSTHFDVGCSANWTNIPLETRYDVANLNEFDIQLTGNDQFEAMPRTQFTIDQNRRLNITALNAETGYTFRLHRRYIRWGAGVGAYFTLNSGEQPQWWWFTGLETPIGYSKYLFSVGYRRLQGQWVQPDQLLSTRLQAVEIGLKRKF